MNSGENNFIHQWSSSNSGRIHLRNNNENENEQQGSWQQTAYQLRLHPESRYPGEVTLMLDLNSSADDILEFARNERGSGDLLRIRVGRGPELGKHSVLYSDPKGAPLSAQISDEAFRELGARRLVVRDSEYGTGNPYTVYRLLV